MDEVTPTVIAGIAAQFIDELEISSRWCICKWADESGVVTVGRMTVVRQRREQHPDCPAHTRIGLLLRFAEFILSDQWVVTESGSPSDILHLWTSEIHPLHCVHCGVKNIFNDKPRIHIRLRPCCLMPTCEVCKQIHPIDTCQFRRRFTIGGPNAD